MFKNIYDIPIGFSDHSTGTTSAAVAVALGAKVIEKHITLDKNYPGPDHPFALEQDEMKKLVLDIRGTEQSMGFEQRILSDDEKDARKMIRRSIVLKNDLKKGDKITLYKIKFARPGTGIPTNEFKFVEGRKVKQDLLAETVLQWNMFTE